MNVNLTLVIQGINFLIAYGLLSRFLLKPAFHALENDNKVRQHLRSKIVNKQTILAHIQEQKRSAWERCRNYFHKNRPEIELGKSRLEISEVFLQRAESLQEKELRILTDHTVQALKERVIHD